VHWTARPTSLHARLTIIERESLSPSGLIEPARRINVDQALADLRYAATDLVELTQNAALRP
jgi:hypothetical protein